MGAEKTDSALGSKAILTKASVLIFLAVVLRMFLMSMALHDDLFYIHVSCPFCSIAER